MTVPSSRALRRRAFAAVSLGVFAVQLDAFALNPALPRIGRDFGIRGDGLSWVVGAYLLAAGALMPLAGGLADRFGRRRMLVAGLTLFAAASAGGGLAPSPAALITARVLQGAGAALLMTAGLALLTTVHPPRLRPRATGGALGIAGVATACGPAAGGVLTEVLSWRAVFWAAVLPAAAAALLARGLPEPGESRGLPESCSLLTSRGLPESRDRRPSGDGRRRPVDRLGPVAGTAAVAALAGGLDRGRARGWMSWDTVALLAVAVTLSVVLVRRERSAAHPWVDPVLFRNRPYLVLTVAGAAANTATCAFLFVVPQLLQEVQELSPTAAGAAFLAPSAAMALAGPVAGRIPPARAVAAMAGCLATAAAGLVLLRPADALPGFLAAATVCGAALGVANALTLTATQALVPPERAGAASGVTKSAVTLAAGLGLPSGPATDPVAAGTAPAWALLGCLLCAAALVRPAVRASRCGGTRGAWRSRRPR
ncbi:MFS transporter [Streptomyces sp. NPDC001922]|uniref:MFS transporter n=1 Tax=Streptomyces sp. NPDC001922 TaxID=3364624 RepID=UPI0036BC64A2